MRPRPDWSDGIGSLHQCCSHPFPSQLFGNYRQAVPEADCSSSASLWLATDAYEPSLPNLLARGSIPSRMAGPGSRSRTNMNDDAVDKSEKHAARTERSDVRGAGVGLVRQETVVL